MALSATDVKSHRFQHERSKATSLCSSLARKPSFQRSAASKRVIGKQSLSNKIKLIPGKIATRAARTNVPAQVTGFLHRTLSSNDLTPQEKQQWVQSGLALSPLVATCTQYSVDFCLAWALIGEWTSRILFPVPKGPWPRHGHAGALLRRYQARSPRMVAWARATFEQGALPSLLFLQGLVPIFTLPGDKMFQARGLCSHKQRPPIMHAYGGAKSGMAQAFFFLLYAAWVRSRAERPSVSYTKAVMEVAWTGHNLQLTKTN